MVQENQTARSSECMHGFYQTKIIDTERIRRLEEAGFVWPTPGIVSTTNA